MCWNKGRLCWKIAKLFYFCHLKKLVRPETFGPYYVGRSVGIVTLSPPKQRDRLWSQPILLLLQWMSGFFPDGKSGRGAVLTIHLHLSPKLRMTGAITLLPLYTSMSSTGTALAVPITWHLVTVLIVCTEENHAQECNHQTVEHFSPIVCVNEFFAEILVLSANQHC